MGCCSYVWEEQRRERDGVIKKRCSEEIWGGSKKYCIFHDPYQTKDKELFGRKLQEKLDSKDYCFQGYVFPKELDFLDMEFCENANFSRATFQGDANFSRATFQGDANFSRATFQGDAYYNEAIFKRTADFSEVIFQEDAYFSRATFQNAYYNEAVFKRTADFSEVIVERNFGLIFRKVKELNFQRAQFLFKGHITADLTKTRFHQAVLENVAFIDCMWPERIYEEIHMEKEGLSFKDLETIYRNLKQNMKRYGNYSLAREFFYREMEMRRKQYTLFALHWWAQNLYRFFFGYGVKVSRLFLTMLAGIIIGTYLLQALYLINVITNITILDVVILSLAIAILLLYVLRLLSVSEGRGEI